MGRLLLAVGGILGVGVVAAVTITPLAGAVAAAVATAALAPVLVRQDDADERVGGDEA